MSLEVEGWSAEDFWADVCIVKKKPVGSKEKLNENMDERKESKRELR